MGHGSWSGRVCIDLLLATRHSSWRPGANTKCTSWRLVPAMVKAKVGEEWFYPSSYINDRLGIPNCSDYGNHLTDSNGYHDIRILEIRKGEWGFETSSRFYLIEGLSTSSGSWRSRMWALCSGSKYKLFYQSGCSNILRLLITENYENINKPRYDMVLYYTLIYSLGTIDETTINIMN